MRKKECLAVLFSMCIAPQFALADNYKSTFELNAMQMDYITAGTEVNAGAAAAAQAAGLIAASFANTLTLTGATSESGGIAAAGAVGTAVGTDAATTEANVTTSANGALPSRTFTFSNNFDGSLTSHSGAVEIAIVPTLPTLVTD